MTWRTLKTLLALALLLSCVVGSAFAQSGRRGVAEILAGRNLPDPTQRAAVVAEVRALQEKRKAAAVARAQERGLPVRVERPDGTVQEVVELDESGEPLYFTTHNLNAAISTGANVLRTVTGLTGSGVVLGMWDGGSGRATHQEFSGGRMVVKDGSASIDHATHVGGTMIASGVQTNARGMAVAATVDSYDWNSDTSEFIARGATAPGQADKLPVSNHSYGYVRGWSWDGSRWAWPSSAVTSSTIETSFGVYNSRARSIDAIAYDAPYYLMFWSAGNEGNNNPTTGSTVSLGGTLVAYDPTLHPAGDGVYRGGFETVADNAVAKNVVVVGAVTDAVTSGVRDVNKANPTGFTSYGPTDDGRIKPDVVANGDSLYSSINSGDTLYGFSSGTSMSSPNAAGTAGLLIQHYGNLFPGSAMRASTLKGLLIHTADDRGNAGPDYKFGWGLVNGKAAADLITDHQANPAKIRMTENAVTTSITVRTHEFTWDGVSPIRATLCWTDPEGPSTTTSDLRTARLVNNLNVKVVAPGGAEYFPYVMPFVGTWTQASMDLPATTGINNTDNVEQVYIAAPPTAGVYQVVVSYSGTLTDSRQDYSLLVSGSANPVLPPPVITSATTASGATGQSFSYQITASNFPTSYSASGLPSGLSVNTSTGLISGSPTVGGTFNATISATNGAGTGQATLVITIARAREIVFSEDVGSAPTTTAIASHNFQNTNLTFSGTADVRNTTASSGYTGASGLGNVFFTTTSGTFLQISGINTLGFTDLSLSLGHYKSTVQGNNQLVIEVSSDGVNYSPLNYSRATGGGTATWLNVQPTGAIPATENLRLRFRKTSTSAQFRIDDVVLTGIPPARPQIVAAATTSSGETETDGAVTYQVVRGTSTTVSVTASDEGGEGNLTYMWAATGGSVTFSPNDSNAAKTATATFNAAGDYTLTVTAENAAGGRATSSVPVRVKQTATSIVVSPSSASVVYSATQQFSAQQRDQFAATMTTQPSFGWSVSGGGTISSGGLFTAGLAGGPYTVTATANSVSGTAQISVTQAAAGVTLGNLSAVYDGSAKTASVTTSPPGLAVSLSYNGSSSAPVNAGSYTVAATVTDPNYTGSAFGTLVIARAAQTISFSALSAKTFGDASFGAGAASSSGLGVTYESSNANVATVSGETITITGAGSTLITASQAGDTNYEAATPVAQTLTVGQATASVTLGGLTRAYDGEPKEVTVTTDPPGLTVNITYDGESTAPSEAGIYAVVATVDDTNYSGSASGTLVIDEELLTFERWIGRFEGLTDVSPEGDPDGDGLRNVEEYFMGLDPTLNDAAGATVRGLTIDGIHLDYRRSKEAHGITGTVRWSTNPGAAAVWTQESVTDVMLQDHGTWELRRASVPWLEGAEQIFLRLDLTVE